MKIAKIKILIIIFLLDFIIILMGRKILSALMEKELKYWFQVLSIIKLTNQ